MVTMRRTIGSQDQAQNRHVVIALRHMKARREALLEKRAGLTREIEELDAAILALEFTVPAMPQQAFYSDDYNLAQPSALKYVPSTTCPTAEEVWETPETRKGPSDVFWKGLLLVSRLADDE